VLCSLIEHILLQVRAGLPGVVWLETSRVFLHRHHEDAFFFEGGVESEQAHEEEVRGHTNDQNWPEKQIIFNKCACKECILITLTEEKGKGSPTAWQTWPLLQQYYTWPIDHPSRQSFPGSRTFFEAPGILLEI